MTNANHLNTLTDDAPISLENPMTTNRTHRTAQDILAERRSVVQEQRRETDRTARAILQFQIDELDRELGKVTP